MREKVLFVCARNKIRSYTAERMFAGSARYEARSRGLSRESRVRLKESDLHWADRIFVMEKNHKDRMIREFGSVAREKKIVCLFIEDVYQAMEDSLIGELRRKLEPYLALPGTGET